MATTNSNLVLKFSMTEDKKESIKNGESSDVAFDFTNYNVEWGYTE